MKRLRFTLFLFLECILSGGAVFSQKQVILEERPLVLPTYDVAPADPNPYFFTGRTYQGAQGHVYPYPMYDVMTDHRHDQTYRSVILENQYTQLCAMPELGGRILWAFDKATNYDFFYRQHVVKPALIGMIGAWMSGGVEWNIPHHHRASSQLPVDYRMVDNADGSKTLWIGETELRHRLKWEVGLTLFPDKSYIEATVNIFNQTPYIQSFLYWANVSVHCNKDYQVIFPPKTQFGVQHAKNEFVDWPVGKSHYGGLDRTGVDLSWWKNHPNSASIFAWNFDDDFLGGYDYGKDAGTVHVANHHVVGGKKFFLWGNNKEAEMWNKMLTEIDGDYLELMVGAFSDNQPDYSWIAPGETKTFKQYWYPAIKMGGIKAANKNAALNIERIATDKIKIAFNTTSCYPHSLARVKNAGKIIFEKSIDIDPKTPFAAEVNVPSTTRDEDILVELIESDGTELVSYRKEVLEPKDLPETVEVPRHPSEYKTIEELYNTGLRIEQFHNATLDAMDYYREALKRDSMDSRVNTVIGIRLAKEAKFAEAEKYLSRAVARVTKNYTSPKDAESLYYLGIVFQQQGKYKEATDYLWKATWRKEFQTAAFYALSQIAAIQNDYEKALEMVQNSLKTNTENPLALVSKAYYLRKLGKVSEASAVLSALDIVDKLNGMGNIEKAFLSGSFSRQLLNEQGRYMGNISQNVLEMASAYGNMGAYDEAISILSAYLQSQEDLHPMAGYYLGYYQQKKGNIQAATTAFAKAAALPDNYCFPFRIEEVDILNTALQNNPADAFGHNYLGNLYYFFNRKEEAVREWKRAVDIRPSLSQAWRNLGFAHERDNDLRQAASCYEKAIKENPSDPRYFYELDLIYDKILKPVKERLALLEKNRKTVEKRDDATAQLVKLYIIAQKYKPALQILKNRHFHVWEGGGDIHSVYVDACLLSGLQKMSKKSYKSALEDFEAGSLYPDNLEVGEPVHGRRNPEAYCLMGMAYEKMGDKVNADSCYKQVVAYPQRGVSSLYYYRAFACQKLGEIEKAKDLLGKLKKYAEGRMKQSGNIDFFSKFGESLDTDKQNAETHYLLGLVALGNNEKSMAQAEFAQALKLNPSHIWAQYYYSSLK
ncbi:DUF5107 domain-containing protein [Coprobacter secundus]|uniref:DUF5107 domain-containing protein n=1 Tax=Coprobacter secundus subsp. similis TaxID=2751153 RepID=A0A7G1HRI0_9BACT|nr:DUF5107 domain-containing protein [Coprobacter secundus]BCI62060.1 hypothetical protein Cop2CBH44_04130 [Coprobacter secundus subsp. similis]